MTPLQVIFLSPPGIVTGTKYESAEKKVFPASPDAGTRVTGIPPTNVVVAELAAGSKTTVASGTESVNAELVIDWLVK